MSISLNNINPLFDTFADWVELSSNSAYIISNDAVTVSSNSTGGTTQGNVFVNGILSSTALALTEGIRGGTPEQTDELNITSSSFLGAGQANINSNSFFNNFLTLFKTSWFEVKGGDITVTSNVNFRSNTLHVSTSGRVGVNTGIADAALKVNGSANISGLATFSSNVDILGSLTTNNLIADTMSFNSVTTDRLNVLDQLAVAGSARIGSSAIVRQALQIGGSITTGETMSISGDLFTNILEVDEINIANPILKQHGGFGLSSLPEGILYGNNNQLNFIMGTLNHVLYHNGEQWITSILPSMAYQNSTNVSITGGNIGTISSLGISGNMSLGANLNVSGSITTTTDITTNSITTNHPIEVSRGGTGHSTLSNNHLIIGNGSNPINFISPEGHTQYLFSDGSSWTVNSLINALLPQLSSLVTQYYLYLGPNQWSPPDPVTQRVIPIGNFLMGQMWSGDWANRPFGYEFNASSTPSGYITVLTNPVINMYITGNRWFTPISYGRWRVMGRMGAAYPNTVYLLQRVA